MKTKKGKISVKININPVWLKEQTDLSRCNCCDDVIYGDMYRLWIMPHVDDLRLKGDQTSIIICKSCLELNS